MCSPQQHLSGACSLSASRKQRATYTPCFTAGTLIKTIDGERLVEDLKPGMRVLTRDNGYQAVVWAGMRVLSRAELDAAPHLRPIKISANAMGPGLPAKDLQVSPQHRMLLNNTQIREWFKSDEVLIAAEHMVCYDGIDRSDVDDVVYVHFMFDQHEIVLANGCWSESFQPRDMSSGGMDAGHRREILELFPELAEDEDRYSAARATVDVTKIDLPARLTPLIK